MSKATGRTRGDRRRNERLTRVREFVAVGNAIVGIDLGEDVQMVVVTDHDSRVLARKKVTGKAWMLGPVLDWAIQQACAAGFASVTVGCEPTGSRWLQVADLAAERHLPAVGVQPLATHRAREAEDYTRDKSDYKDAVLIARLIGQLHCYRLEGLSEEWATLRHLGVRRAHLVTTASGALLAIRDLLGLAWPAVLDCAAKPLEAKTWLAALAVVLDRYHHNPAQARRMGLDRFTAAVRRELPRWGGQRICRRILDAIWAALPDSRGAVIAHRPGALQRATWALDDLRETRGKRLTIDEQLLAQLNTLGVADLLSTIDGLSPVAAACILAEAGDPTRYADAAALVKHAGLNPMHNSSGKHRGESRISKRGRPGLRLAAWRATWILRHHNPVTAARYTHLTGRDTDRLTPGQAHVACAAQLLRWIHAVLATGQPWEATIASGQTPHHQRPDRVHPPTQAA